MMVKNIHNSFFGTSKKTLKDKYNSFSDELQENLLTTNQLPKPFNNPQEYPTLTKSQTRQAMGSNDSIYEEITDTLLEECAIRVREIPKTIMFKEAYFEKFVKLLDDKDDTVDIKKEIRIFLHINITNIAKNSNANENNFRAALYLWLDIEKSLNKKLGLHDTPLLTLNEQNKYVFNPELNLTPLAPNLTATLINAINTFNEDYSVTPKGAYDSELTEPLASVITAWNAKIEKDIADALESRQQQLPQHRPR